jgi:hypothetical protein
VATKKPGVHPFRAASASKKKGYVGRLFSWAKGFATRRYQKHKTKVEVKGPRIGRDRNIIPVTPTVVRTSTPRRARRSRSRRETSTRKR